MKEMPGQAQQENSHKHEWRFSPENAIFSKTPLKKCIQKHKSGLKKCIQGF